MTRGSRAPSVPLGFFRPGLKSPWVQFAASALLAFALWEAIWLVAGGIGFHHSWEVIDYLFRTVIEVEFLGTVAVTVALSLGGLGLGLLVALVVGFALSARQWLEVSSRGSIYFARAIPSVALIPLLMASLGSRTTIVIILVVWLVAIKLVLFVMRGNREIDATLNEQSRLLKLPAVTRGLLVRLPAASAHIVTGLRLSVNRAYGAVLLAGLLAGTPGLGRSIALARLNGDSLAVLGLAVFAGLIGVFFFWLFGELERRVISWRPAG